MANTQYLSTVPAIIKMVAAALGLIAFICAIIPYWSTSVGGGWNQFVAIVVFLVMVGLLFIHLADLTGKVPNLPLLELAVFAGCTLMTFIAFIVACVLASKYHDILVLRNSKALIAAAIFFALLLAVLAIGTFFAFRDYRTGGSSEAGTTVSTQKTTTTITTTSTVPT